MPSGQVVLGLNLAPSPHPLTQNQNKTKEKKTKKALCRYMRVRICQHSSDGKFMLCFFFFLNYKKRRICNVLRQARK